MVGRLALLILFGLMAAQPLSAKPRCTPEREYEPAMCPLVLPPIVHVAVEMNAVKSPLETDPSVDCSELVVTPALIRRYLTRAKQVPSGTSHSQLLWDSCSASGTVLFKDGRSARWSVSRLRVGSLIFDGSPEMTLYCPTCKEKPFVW